MTKKCPSRTTLQFNLTVEETRILLPTKKKGTGYIRIGREKAVPKGARPNFVGFTSSKSSGETVRRVLITLERGSMEEIEAMYTSLQAVLMGKRQEVKGRELTDFHRSIIERRLSSVEEKYRQLKLIK